MTNRKPTHPGAVLLEDVISGCKVRKKLVTLRSKRRKNALRRKILNVSASDERSKAVKKVIFIKLLI